MLTLLAKDFRLLFGKNKSLSKRILTFILLIIFIGCFVGIEVFLFIMILRKISEYDKAPLAFMSLFLFIISLLLIIFNLLNALKLFFDEKDIEQLSVHPVSNSAIIFSKLVFLFITHYVISFIFIYPLFVAYGVMMAKNIAFYYLGLFYPLLAFFFEMGIALILVYPAFLLKKYFKKHLLIKFIITLILMFMACYFYAKVLNIFIEMLAGNGLDNLFTVSSINKFINFRKYQIPLKFLTDLFIEKKGRSFISYLMISGIIFILGLTITIISYNNVRNISINNKIKNNEKPLKIVPETTALIKKEIILLTKNADYTLSFTGLLIIQPFLAYLVIKALNTIFTSGMFAYYISVVPSFIPLLDVLILMLFTVIIHQGANQYISMEKKTIKLMKTLPVKANKQLLIKILIPYLLSVISLFITILVLLISKTINLKVFLYGFILVILLLSITTIISLKEELSIRNNHPRSTFLSSFYAYFLPIVYFLLTAFLSFMGISLDISYLMGILILIILGIPFVIYLIKKANKLFMELDVIN